MRLFLLFLFASIFTTVLPQDIINIDKFEYLSPVPGSKYHLPQTNIIIRHGESFTGTINNTDFEVNGSVSGNHGGTIYLAEDSKTVVFIPDIDFVQSEEVSVIFAGGQTTSEGGIVDSLKFNFYITGNPLPGNNNLPPTFMNLPDSNFGIQSFGKNKRSGLNSIFPEEFPAVNISNRSNSDSYFLALNQGVDNYLAIINGSGIPLYYKKNKARLYDFKVQPSGILSYYDESSRIYYGMDSLFQIVDSFYCRNGYSTDFHEMQIDENGHMFMLSYDPQVVNMNEIKPGADTAAIVYGCVVQEINRDGIVIWQWRTWDHYNFSDADSSFVDFYQRTIDFCHINSIEVVDEGRIILSAKNFNEITEVSRNTGKINWRLGGNKNQFTIPGEDALFEQQHDARLISGNRLTLFDNRKFNSEGYSRALVYNIDVENKTAELVKVFAHNPEVKAKNMGNFQTSGNGNYIIGWGNTGFSKFYMSEVDSMGNTVSSDSLVGEGFIYSYRAFKFPWKNKLISSNREYLSFQNSYQGIMQTDSLIVTNNSSHSIEIRGIYNTNDIFIPKNNFPITAEPGEEIPIYIEFSTSNEIDIIDTVYIAAYYNNAMASMPIELRANNTTSADENGFELPGDFQLSQNFPNPFNPSTKIRYTLPYNSRVKLSVYNILGEEINTLINEIQYQGNYTVNFFAGGLSSGIYFYKINASEINGRNFFSSVKKMMLIK